MLYVNYISIKMEENKYKYLRCQNPNSFSTPTSLRERKAICGHLSLISSHSGIANRCANSYWSTNSSGIYTSLRRSCVQINNIFRLTIIASMCPVVTPVTHVCAQNLLARSAFKFGLIILLCTSCLFSGVPFLPLV